MLCKNMNTGPMARMIRQSRQAKNPTAREQKAGERQFRDRAVPTLPGVVHSTGRRLARQRFQLHGKLQNQNKEHQITKGEYQKFLEDLVQDFQFVDHGKVQDPNKPSAKLMQSRNSTWIIWIKSCSIP
jgi:hypothetical protein